MPIRPGARGELPDFGTRQHIGQQSVAHRNTECLHIREVADVHHLRNHALRLLGRFIWRLPPDVLLSEWLNEVAAYADYGANTILRITCLVYRAKVEPQTTTVRGFAALAPSSRLRSALSRSRISAITWWRWRWKVWLAKKHSVPKLGDQPLQQRHFASIHLAGIDIRPAILVQMQQLDGGHHRVVSVPQGRVQRRQPDEVDGRAGL